MLLTMLAGVTTPATWATGGQAKCVTPAALNGTTSTSVIALSLNGIEAEPRCSCDSSCTYAADGSCDDGGDGSNSSLCGIGTDCRDCGVRCDRPSDALVRLQYYEHPAMAQLAPSRGPVSGHQLVTVVALGLEAYGGVEDARCMFGSVVVRARMKTPRVLLCPTPPHLAGTVPVRVALNAVDFSSEEESLEYEYSCASYADTWNCVRDPGCAACSTDPTEDGQSTGDQGVRQSAPSIACVALHARCDGLRQVHSNHIAITQQSHSNHIAIRRAKAGIACRATVEERRGE